MVVGSGVVRMQEGGVHEESEKSPVLPNTYRCSLLVKEGTGLVSYPGYESVLLTARDLVTPKLKLHDVVESGEGP